MRVAIKDLHVGDQFWKDGVRWLVREQIGTTLYLKNITHWYHCLFPWWITRTIGQLRGTIERP